MSVIFSIFSFIFSLFSCSLFFIFSFIFWCFVIFPFFHLFFLHSSFFGFSVVCFRVFFCCIFHFFCLFLCEGRKPKPRTSSQFGEGLLLRPTSNQFEGMVTSPLPPNLKLVWGLGGGGGYHHHPVHPPKIFNQVGVSGWGYHLTQIPPAMQWSVLSPDSSVSLLLCRWVGQWVVCWMGAVGRLGQIGQIEPGRGGGANRTLPQIFINSFHRSPSVIMYDRWCSEPILNRMRLNCDVVVANKFSLCAMCANLVYR